MSIRYNDKLVATTWKIIKDDAPQVNTTYSSEKLNEVLKPNQDEINKKIALTKGVRDVVNTYQDLLDYDTTQLVEGDIINVLKDENKDNGSTYYRWDGQAPLTYIGEIPPFYTKEETDIMLDGKQDRLESGVNIKTVNNQSVIGQGNIELQLDIDKWFPVGTVYQIQDDTFDPNVTFGGTWEKIEGRFLRTGETAKRTGGSSTVTLSTNEMPSHNHTVSSHSHSATNTILKTSSYSTIPSGETWICAPLVRNLNSANNSTWNRLVFYKHETSSSGWLSAGETKWLYTYCSDLAFVPPSPSVGSKAMTLNNAGGSKAHNNMHPYVVANIWVRTA